MKFSKDGYKRNSKDRNNPYNIIPSGNITMKDVDFPVFGIDNLGNIEIMMPGGEYKFPGSSVFEIPLAQIGKELSELEKKINAYLNNPGDRAKAFSESEEELSNIDNLRHAMAGRYTAEELQNKVKGIPYIGSILDATGVDKLVGFLGSNALGIGHEVSTLVEDDRPFFAALQETGEDVFNNFVGSIVGSTDASSERKDNMLQFLSYNNLLPDGYVQTDPNFSENVYFKNPDTTIKKPNFDSYQGGGERKYQVEVIKYPLGYPGMPPGHIESRILNTEDLPEKYKKLDEDGDLIYKPYLNAWPSRNREVDYDPKYDYEPGVQTLILNLNESDLEKYMNASQLSRAGGMEIPFTNKELNTMFGFGKKGQYDFFTDNCADQTCRALGLSDANSSMLGVTTPQQVYDALMDDPRLLAGSVKGDPTVYEVAGKSIYNVYRTTPWSLSQPLREKAVNYIEDNTDLQFDWEGVKNIPGYHYRNWIKPTGDAIEKGAKAVKETYQDLSQSFIDGINKINPMNWKNGGSLPKAQNGDGYIEQYTTMNQDGVYNPYTLTDEEMAVANKYQPVVDWYDSYLQGDTFNHLYNKILDNTSDPWVPRFMKTGLKQTQQYVQDYPYVKQHNDIWNWDPLNNPVNVAPSIIEKRTNTGGRHTSKASNQTTTKSRISIDPQNEYFGPYSTEQQEGIMAHELGHTEGGFFTGSPELDAEINKRNKAYQRVWNNLSEEDKKSMTENPVEIGYWLKDNYNSSSDFHDAASHEVRSDIIRFRYLADKAGIYNSSGDYKKFNESDLKKMKEQFGNNRLFRHFEDEDIIWLMDNVAQQTPEGTDNPYEIVDDFGQSSFMSRYGGQLPKAQEGKETISFDDLEKGIRYVESLNGELMLNPESSATGLYGQLWSEIKDTYDGTREEFAKDLDYQKQLFKDRANGLIEGVPGLINNGIDLYNEYSEVEHGMSMLEIAALSNMLGRQGTRKYIGNHIRDGRSLESVFPNLYGEDAKYKNKTPGEYIEKFKKGLLQESKLGGEFMKKMNRLKQQLELYNSGKEISGIAKKELELRGLIKQPIMRTGGSVSVKEGDYLGKIARDAGYTLDEVMQFNPQLKDRKDYVIYPGEKIYFDNETREYDVSGKPKLFHTVQRGDTLGEIASKYHLNLTEVAKLNNITGDAINRIYPGDQILLPEHAKFERNDDIKKQEDIAKSPVTNTDSVVVNTPSPVNDIWVEREYDSETGRYKIVGGKKQNIQEINTYNNLQTIIKGKNDFDKSTSTTNIYTVKEGDTLSRIASDFGVPLNTLVTDNNISDPSKILVNQKITVNKNTAKPYLVIDKSKSKMHLIYPGDTQPRESYDILTGTMVGDQATVTKSDYFYQGKKLTQDELNQHMEDNGVKNIRELLSIKLDGKPLYTSSTDYYAGNRMTGAGKYTISETNADGGRSYRGDAAPGELVPSFNLVNEQGVEQALAIHGVTRGRTASLYDNNPYNNRLTSGCINGKCEDLQSLYENPDITKGTEVYVLPENEDSGSSFVYENGKINFYTKRENQERARKGFYKTENNKNRYSGKGGDEGEFVEGGPGINVTTNFGNYNPIMFEFDKSLHQSEGANNPYVQADGSVINLNKEFTEHTQPFLNSLAENKKRVMETINIDGDLYNDLALVSFGIYANESGMGDINPLGEDILKLGRKTGVSILNKFGVGLNPVGSGSVERKYNIAFQNDPSNSVGWTQLRVGDGNTGPNEREALARYDSKYDTKFTNKIETVLSQDDLNTLQSYDQRNGTDLYSQATSNNNKGRVYVNRLGEVQYHKYDIDNSLLMDPEYSAIATAIILGERYKNQISRDKKNSSDFDIYHEVAKTWRPGTKSDDYARLVNANIPLVTLRETDINNIDKNVIIKGEYQNTSETIQGAAVEAAHNTVLPTFLSTIFGFSRGGEFGLNNQIQFYKDYVEGLYKNTNQEKSAKKLYDKLNRMYYNEYRGTDSNALDIMNLMNSGTNN